MSVPILSGVAEIAARYDLFILDVWGVIHDGIAPYPGVDEALRRLRADGRFVVLLSNAPRPSDNVGAQLATIGVPDSAYDMVLTSGQATRDALLARDDTWHAALGPRCYHLGPDRCLPTIEGLDLATDLGDADYIVCTGLFDDETETAEDFRDLLRPAVERRLPLICANPDIIVMRGDRLIPCAGAIAQLYEEMGGEVVRHGKPFAGVYDRVLAHAGCSDRARAIMIGDGFPTDIRGAREYGIDSIWVAGGIHADEVGYCDGQPLDASRVAAVAAEAGERPTAVMPRFAW